jgi:hypothetical protein
VLQGICYTSLSVLLSVKQGSRQAALVQLSLQCLYSMQVQPLSLVQDMWCLAAYCCCVEAYLAQVLPKLLAVPVVVSNRGAGHLLKLLSVS